MSGSFQYLDQDDKWEAASRALTCSHICLQPKPDAPTSINSSVALDVKGETEAGSAVRGPAVYTFTPREAGAVCGTNHTSHILCAFIQVRFLAQHSNKGIYSALTGGSFIHPVPARAARRRRKALHPLLLHTLDSSHSSLVDVYSISEKL